MKSLDFLRGFLFRNNSKKNSFAFLSKVVNLGSFLFDKMCCPVQLGILYFSVEWLTLQQMPTMVWQLHENLEAMFQRHKGVMEWIVQQLADAIGPFQVTFDGQHHMVELANGWFFKIIMRLPPEYVSRGQLQYVIFIFSLYDLYLLGFLNGNK